MLGNNLQLKTTAFVGLLFEVSKDFEKLVNNRIVDHLEKCGLFCDLWYVSRSFRLSADLLTVVSDRTGRAFTIWWSNGLVVKVLDSQSRGPVIKTNGWLQGRLSLSSFRGQ